MAENKDKYESDNDRHGPEEVEPGPNESGDVGGDSISRDEFIWLNAKTLFDQTLKNLSLQSEQAQRALEVLTSRAQTVHDAAYGQLLALQSQLNQQQVKHAADLDAQTLQLQAQLNANTVQAQRLAIERENLANQNATHAIALAQQQTIDHRDLSFDSALPNANVGTATEARGSGRILAGKPDDTVPSTSVEVTV